MTPMRVWFTLPTNTQILQAKVPSSATYGVVVLTTMAETLNRLDMCEAQLVCKEAQWMCNPHSVIFQGFKANLSRFHGLFLFKRLEVLLSVFRSKPQVICAASFLRSLNWWQLRLMQLPRYPEQQLFLQSPFSR